MKGSQFQEVIDHLLNLAYFIYFGAVLPWNYIGQTVAIWKLVLVALWMMTIRRIPSVMALSPWIPAFKNKKEAFFAGWFGPMGASAIFYALLAVVYLDVDQHPLLEIVMFTVLTSIVFHGGSVPLFNLTLNYQEKVKLERTLTRERELAITREGTDTTIAIEPDHEITAAATPGKRKHKHHFTPRKTGNPVMETVLGFFKKGSSRPSTPTPVRGTLVPLNDFEDVAAESNNPFDVSSSSASAKSGDVGSEAVTEADAVVVASTEEAKGGIDSLVAKRVA
ncbi:hypothetical protein HDU97_008202 [Phlyctochytrium planicorne]|nr:hypothetical protein HDU97_008202 [Phlyctochytrium planicorne]